MAGLCNIPLFLICTVTDNPQSSRELDSRHYLPTSTDQVEMSKSDTKKERERDGKLHPRKRPRSNPTVAYVEPLKPASREWAR